MSRRVGGSVTLPATVSITVSHGGGRDDRYHISITDDVSHIIMCEVSMTMTDFAKALSHTDAPAEATWVGLDRVGWTAENKTERGDTEDNLHTFEVDGWTARSSDIGNAHKRCESGGFLVVFFRHVPPAE